MAVFWSIVVSVLEGVVSISSSHFQFYIVVCAGHWWFVFIDLWLVWNVFTRFFSILYIGF